MALKGLILERLFLMKINKNNATLMQKYFILDEKMAKNASEVVEMLRFIYSGLFGIKLSINT